MTRHSSHRSLLVALAVVAVSGLLLAGSGGPIAEATSSSGERPAPVTIVPFRLVDTRPPPDGPIGGSAAPFGPGETRTYTPSAASPTVPTDATGVVLNITALNATADSFLTLWPAGAARPLVSTLNPYPGRIVFNGATVDLAAGSFSAYNLDGTVDLVIDVVGYLVHHDHADLYPTHADFAAHQHDDRYYTEAETDALLAAPAVHELEVPIGSLTEDTGNAVIESRISGYDWENSGAEAASLNLARPDDWDGTSPVVVRIFYLRSVNAAGEVRFFVRPRSFEVGETWLDKAGIGTTAPSVSGSVFQSLDITIPAAELQKAWWNLSFQRTPLTYTASVLVYAVTVTYAG